MDDDEDTTARENRRIGVLLLNLGGPWTLEDVRLFLLNLFRDRFMIPFPGGPALQGLWAHVISSLRARKVRKRYAAIGGGSPLLYWTRRQASGLQRLLNNSSRDPIDESDQESLGPQDSREPGVAGLRSEDPFVLAVGMRYSSPAAAAALHYLKGSGCRRIVVLPLFPHECRATTGSIFHHIEMSSAPLRDDVELIPIRSFHDHPGYIGAVVERIREGIAAFPKDHRQSVAVLFSAHAIPCRMVRDGDPYVRQIEETVDLVVGELNGEIGPHRLAYQSRTGPVRWTGPGTNEVLTELGEEGASGVLVIPISFVSDHIETLHEIDIEFADVARGAGIRMFRRAACLNDSGSFLSALSDLVLQALERNPASRDSGKRG